jgi:hypothetical protein
MDLYQQLNRIHTQCRVRLFTDRETMEMMRLCVYAYLDHFPQRPHQLPNRNQVLTSVREQLGDHVGIRTEVA